MTATRSSEFSIQRWLDELPDEEIEREMAELQERINALGTRYNTLREARDLKQRFRSIFGSGDATPTSRTEVKGEAAAGETTVITTTTTVSGNETPRPSSIPKAILLVMESSPAKREWNINDLYKGLVERGWLHDSHQGLRSLSSALSRMTLEGGIHRVGRGLYAAPRSPDEVSPSLLDSREDESD